jgi:hypothetical protein
MADDDGTARLALWNYFQFSRAIRRAFHDIAGVDPTHNGTMVLPDFRSMSQADLARNMALISYWYASLYVVIEGWQELQLADAKIDAILLRIDLDTLRRFRNAVFQYQRAFDLPKFDNWMLHTSLDTIAAVLEVDSAFKAYFASHVGPG